MREGILTPSARINHVADDVRSVALDVQAQAIRGDGRGGVTYGLEMWDNVTRSRGWEEDPVTGAETSSFRWSAGEPISTGRFPDGSRFGGAALYAIVDQAWGPLRIQVGGRASLYRTSARVGDSYGGDVDSRFGNVTGEAGFVYRASEAVSLRARAAQAFRAPNIYDLTLVGDVPGGIALPNPDLGPEHSYTLETGANWTRGPWRTELTVFRIGINDLLDRTYGTFQGRSTHGPDQLPILTIQNIGSAIIDGIEGTFSAPLPPGDGCTCRLRGLWATRWWPGRSASGGTAEPGPARDPVVSDALAGVPGRAFGLDRVLWQDVGRAGPARLSRPGGQPRPGRRDARVPCPLDPGGRFMERSFARFRRNREPL